MKKILSLSTLLLSCFLLSQFINPKITLKKDWVQSETFKGFVAGKNITLHLEHYQISGWHDKVFSVTGWYQYDQYQQKIPLIGYYNGDLLLYNFGENQKKIEQTKFVGDLFCWTEPCPAFSDYKEFLEIKQGDGKIQKGKLKIQDKEFTIKLNTQSLDVTSRNEWLHLPNGKVYNLLDILDGYGGNEIVSTFEDKTENRIMLSFERDSNFNKQGMCGASPPETGYRLLTFDKNWKIKEMQVYSTNSCLDDVECMKEMQTKYDYMKAYYLYFQDSLNLLTINLKNSTFGVKKLRSNYNPYSSFWSKRLFSK
ncbi:hypothetical protein Q73A0000_11945 [Kaistella flava (ex Peng et al. 2021)]|uniref:DUF306 domain-containing protein n=1 Tax=Kaistella flava (ex Peng et al. 2021) TaxID=2038776 RepID=A0A7M2YA33_9FLAO|nr:hypothetical protein [Kaistella flava (ex Peng et al. 2021)]QOW11021.1 hypothetical protein Q73A0000_11945 [Kaistella flava (ex Peng et al. 2021)]